MTGPTDTSPTVAEAARDAARALLGCLAAELAKVADPPGQVCLRTGVGVELSFSTTRDECCEGLAWVRVVTIYPSEQFPDQDAAARRCGPLQWAAVLEMGVARCMSVPDATTIVSCEEWTAITEAVLADAAAMRRALCCLTTDSRDEMYLAGQWTALPSEGGCVGGTQQVTVAVPACDC